LLESNRLNVLTQSTNYETADMKLKDSYNRMLSYLESLLRDWFSHIREQLAKIHSGIEVQEAINTYTLINDETIKELSL